MSLTFLGAIMTNFGRKWDAKKQLNEINKRANGRVQNIGDENIAYTCQRMGDSNRMGKLPLQIYKLLSGPYKISVPSLLPLGWQRNIIHALQMGSLECQNLFSTLHSDGVERASNQTHDVLLQWKQYSFGLKVTWM